MASSGTCGFLNGQTGFLIGQLHDLRVAAVSDSGQLDAILPLVVHRWDCTYFR